MKKHGIVSIAVVALGVAVASPQAQAGDEGWAAFGGFVGGTILSSFTSGHRSSHHHVSSHRSSHGHSSHHHGRVVEQPSGHYEYQTRQVWVPGHYDYERDECGHRIKVWHPGHHKSETVKVWVSHRSSYRSCR
jgi:hypothetical protein